MRKYFQNFHWFPLLSHKKDQTSSRSHAITPAACLGGLCPRQALPVEKNKTYQLIVIFNLINFSYVFKKGGVLAFILNPILPVLFKKQ